ncbi:MAG: acetoin utilization protein AcuC [Actinomycetota bacterium]|nr:acetoin utilization protein AcuC [Actinomycetota bacterium]
MSGDACMVYDHTLVRYDFGIGHPMSPLRVDLTYRLAKALGVVGEGGLAVVPAPALDPGLLIRVHSPEYVEAVQSIVNRHDERLDFGIGTPDCPAFEGMHQASAHVAGASVEAARAVWSGEVRHAVNIAGGLHHAMPAAASGFCIYNDVAIAIQWLLDQGAERVAYVDVDVHHGDGVQRIFYDDPRVLTVSIHETPQTLFPGTGLPTETGGPGAEGSAVNLALPPGTSDAGWLRAFHAVVPAVVREFAPQVLVTQHGCDTHMDDPLANLMLSVDGQRAAYLALHDLAHEVSGGRWVVTGGGGYAIVDVVPRAWTHLLGIVAGRPVDPDTVVPQAWREHAEQVTGSRGQLTMTDGRGARWTDWSQGYDPDGWLDRAVMATRSEVFPLHGLDPQP